MQPLNFLISMRKVYRPKHLKELNEKLTFGIHKGKDVQYLINYHPEYMDWAINKSGFITFSQKILDAYRSASNLAK
jgi:hypothetical protein